MDQQKKHDMASCIALCDQAIAPLTQITRILGGIVPDEIARAQAAGEDKAIDAYAAIKHQYQYLGDVGDVLHRLKVGIEGAIKDAK